MSTQRILPDSARFAHASLWVIVALTYSPLHAQPGREDEAVNVPPKMSVLVLGPEGKPVEGAQVHASVWTREVFKANRDYLTDARGMALVELPKTLRILRVWAQKKGHPPLFAQWWKERQPDGGQIPEEFTFRLQKGSVVGGRVVNEDGQPIAGATVEVRRRSAGIEAELAERPILGVWLAEGDDDPCGALTTDHDGRWVLDNVPVEDFPELSVKLSHPDYVDDERWGGLQTQQAVTFEHLQERTATIVMKRGVRLRGVVIAEETKQRIADAVVIWGDDPYFQTGPQEVKTDQRGFYRLPPLTPQSLNVTVVAKGWEPQVKTIELSEETADEQFSFEASFRLNRGHTVRIRFVDQDGEPVPNVSVGIVKWRGAKSLYNHRHPNVVNTQIPAKSDERGIYEWTWAPEDAVEYSFGKEDYQDPGDFVFAPADKPHEIVMRKKR